MMCNTAVDSLATFTHQASFERSHPECAGYCGRRQCLDAVATGGACTSSFECGAKGYCAGGKCVANAPAIADVCTDSCANGARCVNGHCAAPKNGGEDCTTNVECRGRCAKDDAGSGKCGPDCPSFLKPAK
jgi:hypothetical protein